MGNKSLGSMIAVIRRLALCLIGLGEASAQIPNPSWPVEVQRVAGAALTIKTRYVDLVDDAKVAAGCRDGMLARVDPAKLPRMTPRKPATSSLTDQFVVLLGSINQHAPETGSEAQLAVACLDGALGALDARSAYLDVEDFRELQVGTRGLIGGVGLEFEVQDGFPVVVSTTEGGPAERAGLKAGDIVMRIDAVSTEKMRPSQVIRLLRGGVGSSVELAIKRTGSAALLTPVLTREVIRIIQSVASKQLVPGYTYIRIAQFQESTGPLVAQAVETAFRENQGDLKGLILDLRNSPGGLLNACVAVAAVFLPRGALIVYTDGRSEDARLKLEARRENYIRGRLAEDYIANLPPAVKTVPMAVLVNVGTASGSELVAAALQDHKRARIFGTPTSAANTVQTILPLGDNTALRLTTARMHSPNGKPVGPVIPDVALEAAGLPVSAFGTPGDSELKHALKLLGAEGPAGQR